MPTVRISDEAYTLAVIEASKRTTKKGKVVTITAVVTDLIIDTFNEKKDCEKNDT